MVVLNEVKCERCGAALGSSVAFRYWWIIASDASGEGLKVFEPTPGINRDADEAMAKAAAETTDGTVWYRCPDCALQPAE